MKRFTFRFFMMACFLVIAGYSSAQLRIETNAQNGSVATTDTITGAIDWIYDFDTNQALSYANYIDSTGKYDIGLKSFRNRNGYQANVYTRNAANDADSAVANSGSRMSMPKYTSGANILHISSLASLDSILNAHYVNDTTTSVSTLKPSAALFDVPGGGSAFGTTPGKYKKVEVAFYLKFVGYNIKQDVTFDIITYDEGMGLNGATASYDLVVYLGSDSGDPAATVDDIYTTGTGTKTVSLAEATGLMVSDFANENIYVYLKTTGTGTEIADDVRDPMIVIDNIAATLYPPVWIEPDVASNQVGSNEDNPLEGPVGEETMMSIPIKTEGRLGSMKIVDNLYLNGGGNKMKKPLTFLETGAVKANDGNGNYTVDVEYTLTPAEFNAGTMEWSSQSLEIAAPDSLTDDDMMFYFNAMPDSVTYSSRLEMDNGTRIFYDIFIKGVDTTSTMEWNISSDDFNTLGTIAETTVVNGLTIYAASGKEVVVDENGKTLEDMTFTHRLKLGGSGAFDENGQPLNRVLAFDVMGNTKITVDAMSSSGSADRVLNIAAGSKDVLIGEFPALGASLTQGVYEYTGEATTIYLFSPSSGVNIYYIKAEPLTTAINQVNIEQAEVNVYPNPARDYVKISFTANEAAKVSLALYNLVGQKIEISANEQYNAGNNEITVNTQRLTEGMYVYVLKVGKNLYKGKLNIAK